MCDLKIDTLDKKPKLYGAAALTGLLIPALALCWRLGGGWKTAFCAACLCLYLLVLTGLLIRAFFLQIRYNPYSYNTIIYFGFALFTLAVGALYLLGTVRAFRSPGQTNLPTLLGWLTESAKTYMLFTLPFLLVFSVALAVSNLSLIRHEGFRPVNVLGIALALALMAGEAVIYCLNYYVSGSQREVMLHDLGTNLLAAVYLYLECMLLGTMVADAITARYEPRPDKDYIIVPGCAIRADGTPTPLLRGRVDRALDFARKQERLTGHAPVLVLSGGQGGDEPVSEAESMRRYLESRGVGSERMLLEDQSTDTAENMRFSRQKILAEKPDAKIAFSTTNYHVFRAGLKARRAKLRAVGMGAKSKWYFWPNASVREFVGLLTEHRGKQALILCGLLAAYAALTLIYYHI